MKKKTNRKKNQQKTFNPSSSAKGRSLEKNAAAAKLEKTRNASATHSVKNCNEEYFLIYGVHKKIHTHDFSCIITTTKYGKKTNS